MVEPDTIETFVEAQANIKEMIGTKTKAWMEKGGEISSPSRVAR